MQIAIVTPVYPPYRGGMGSVAWRDANVLKARGFEVQVFTPDYGREKKLEATYLSSLLRFGNAALLPSLLWSLKRVDLAHLHYPFYGGAVFVWLWSVLTRRPYVMTYHMQAKASGWRELAFSLHRWLIEPMIVRRARAVFVSSFDYAQSINLKHHNLIELPFSVDTQRFSPGRDDAFRAKHDIPSSSLVFVFVGGLDTAHAFKGVDVLIRAAAGLSMSQDWRVLIVGEGDLKTSFMKLAQTLGVNDRVIFTGAVSDDDLPRAYRASDVHVLPSTSQSEAFGLVTLEAAASGLPSVVSDLPGVRTLVVNNETGLIVMPGDHESLRVAMQSFVNDRALVQRLGSRARERAVSSYSPTALADKLVQVYNGFTASGQV